jgi:mono/diheme cytochrome c family protein
MRADAKKIASAQAVAASVGVLLLLGALVGRLGGDEWEALQRRYNQLQERSGRRTIAPGIRSIRPAASGEQRCVSCHLGVALPDAHGPPFQAHPGLACSVDPSRVGCVACHRGEPLRLTAAAAHGLDRRSPRRLLGWRAGRRRRRLMMQAGCAQCHLDRRRGLLRYDREAVPEVAAGMDMFVSQGCPACHRVAGVYCAAENGPALSRVGRRLPPAAIRRRILRPRAANAVSPMPPTGLAGRDVDRLVLFLSAQVGVENELGSSAKWSMTSRRPRLAEHLGLEVAAPGPAVGALWVRSAGCAGCHRVGRRDGGVVDLQHVGWTATAEEIRQALRRPRDRFTGSYMPRLDLPGAVEESILAFLARKAPLPSTPGRILREVCGRCHGKTRDPRWVVLGRAPPDLRRSGRPVPRRLFVETVRAGRSGSAMAPWGRVLSPRFIETIYDQLVGNRDHGHVAMGRLVRETDSAGALRRTGRDRLSLNPRRLNGPPE